MLFLTIQNTITSNDWDQWLVKILMDFPIFHPLPTPEIKQNRASRVRQTRRWEKEKTKLWTKSRTTPTKYPPNPTYVQGDLATHSSSPGGASGPAGGEERRRRSPPGGSESRRNWIAKGPSPDSLAASLSGKAPQANRSSAAKDGLLQALVHDSALMTQTMSSF